MPEIKVQNQCSSLDNLVEADSFGESVGPLPKQTDSGFLLEALLQKEIF